MSLNATNFVVQGPIKSVDMKQFVDLFTGVMTDQPVTFKNTLMVGGSQGSSTPPLKLYGVAGQTGNLIELYPTSGSANPTFGFGALGNFAWGPGSPAANDTFLSRIALQNGHVTDTAGLLVQPYLEVQGNISALGYTFTNQATITGPGANPFQLVVNQDLLVNRDLVINRDLLVRRFASFGPTGISFTSATVVIQSQPGTLTGTTQWQAIINGTFTTAATQTVIGVQASNTLPSGLATGDSVQFYAGGITVPAGSTVQNSYGFYSLNTGGAGITRAYGVFINNVTGASSENWGLYNNGTSNLVGNVTIGGGVGISGNLNVNPGYIMCGASASTPPYTQQRLVLYNDSTNWAYFAYGGDANPRLVFGSSTGPSLFFGYSSAYNNTGNFTSVMSLSGAGNLQVVGTGLFQGPLGTWSTLSCYNLTTTANINVGADVIFNTAGSALRLSGGVYITSAGAGPTLVYRTNSPAAHSFEFVQGGYAPIYASAFTPASARKFKTGIVPLNNPLSLVLDNRVHGVRYAEVASGLPRIGFVADDWLDVEPSVVGFKDGEIETLDYDRISAVTFEALKQYAIQTNARLAALEARMEKAA